MAIKMYGPAQDGSGTIVNRDVPELDVAAYEAAGYKRGSAKDAPTAEEYGASKPAKESTEDDEVDLSKMTKAELLEHAEANGIEVNKSATKDEMIAAIEG